MNRLRKDWTPVWSSIVLVLSAAAANAQLAVELPDLELALPSASPPHYQEEGLPYLTENELVNELLTQIGRQDYERALALVRDRYGTELAAIENGDPAGLLRERAGPGRLPVPVPVGGTELSATMLYLIGTTYFGLERYEPAETALKAALVPLPDYLRVHETLGVVYIRMERYEDARVHLTRAAELGLNTAGLHAALGYINALDENWWGVVSAYQQALTLEHDNQGWQSSLLQGLNETQQYAAGLALVEQMLQDEPNDPVLWLYRAHLSLNSDRRAVALTSLETAIRLGDDSVANKQVCATLHMEMGSIARAVELLRGAVAQDLQFDFIDQALARLGYEEQWDYFRELLASVETRRSSLTELQRSRLLNHRSSLLLHDGNRQVAIASLQEALDLDASNADALMALGGVYQADRDYTRAELMFQRASVFDLHRENALVSLAQLAIDQQAFERALALLRDVIGRNPTRTDLQRNVDVLENLVLAQSGD